MNTGLPWSGLVAALVGAATLHMAVGIVLSEGFDPPGASLHKTAITEKPRVTIDIRPVVQTRPLLAPPADPPAEAQPVVQSMAADAPSNPSIPITSLAQDTAAAEGRRYFDVKEVDTPAVPRPEWQVDVPLLMGIGVRSFSVEVLIGETGIAERCSLTRIEPEQSAALRQSVATQLCETVLSPAMRRGVAVPSVRHIELVLALP